ncbi:MAG: hydantoinase B/oxoprolinase family protein [Gammaproteobacteria bacterium]|nr:hydantoinase B/oxoprolinase family protein [Gammaproteobacteria bacterium]
MISENPHSAAKWQFWIDRGGTFTDLVALAPDGDIKVHKLLSENPQRYPDAAIQGMRDLLGLDAATPLPVERIAAIKMGTTVATNALLERRGEPTLLLTTRGFRDALRIAYQVRPRLFDLDIRLPGMLFSEVAEIDERMSAQGEVLRALQDAEVSEKLQAARDAGLRSVAIVFMHGYRYPAHERRAAQLARQLGFSQVSVSSEVSPLMGLVGRGDTTLIDAYLSPVLRRYVGRIAAELTGLQQNGGRLMFMQSNGGLTDVDSFQGKDAILSGPAGGVVGMVQTAGKAGFDKLIGFDMGGTSTDVSHYNGEYERSFETEVAGVRLRAPMMLIHTVAAGGGSILHFDGARYRVGPDSAGADPGPACYRNGGPLTITDCNVMLGKLDPAFFPPVFGPDGDQPLDRQRVVEKFTDLAGEIRRATGDERSAQQVAEGFLAIAVENMANAIKKISVQRGYDVSEYTLVSFGGAGGQHACLVADALAIKQVYLHPHAGVLSAYGIGLADVRVMREKTVEAILEPAALDSFKQTLAELQDLARDEMQTQGFDAKDCQLLQRLQLRYEGSDTAMLVDVDSLAVMRNAFEDQHSQRFGFISPEKQLIVQSAQVELVAVVQNPAKQASVGEEKKSPGKAEKLQACLIDNEPAQRAFFRRESLCAGQTVEGPAVIIEQTGTIVVEPGWRAIMHEDQSIVLERYQALPARVAVGTAVDPVMLEIFNNLFMNVAEQMGTVLQNTAISVNIKERLDFSCAIFDPDGDLIANAPHMPVHLGSMSESIKAVMRENMGNMKPGDAFVLNAPYNGGTHLPDITVIKPVFREGSTDEIIFYVAARGHHADIGGISPGSIPADSTHVEQEGILIDNVKLVSEGRFLETEMRTLLADGPWPARNIDINIADLKAEVAACEKGAQELSRVIAHFGLDVVHAYMRHVQDNAEESVRRVLDALNDSSFSCAMDDGSQVTVTISVDRRNRSATIDFSGTSPTHRGNFNAPTAVCYAAVLYVFRCMVDTDIPLNAGCLKPLRVIIPENSMINPSWPAAVVAGNVETSQLIVDTLFGALGVMGEAQGTMNNFIWGNERYQYYETICGGAGATANADGCDAVHTHMTNSRLTDPEVLEWRFPVVLEDFFIRQGSGGAGLHRGGDGVVRKVRFLDQVTANIISGHRLQAPYGMQGGEAGMTGNNTVIRKSGEQLKLGGRAQVELQAGDMFMIETPGGGGYGKPREETLND